MTVRIPTADDLEGLMRLNAAYHVDRLSEAQSRRGYLGKVYTADELAYLTAREHVVIAEDGGHVVGYYLIGRKEDPDTAFYLRNPGLTLADDAGRPLAHVAYPTQVCIDEAYRGRGLFGRMLHVLAGAAASRYTEILCSVSERNPVSLRAHVNAGWEPVNTFEGRTFFRFPLA